MDDLISRQAVLDEISDYNNDLDYTTNELYDRIKRMSSVNPQLKTGHWIKHDNGAWWECSKCHAERAYGNEYCPDCGSHNGDIAKMVEPQESEDKCKNCEYYRNPDYTRCHECKAESEDKE